MEEAMPARGVLQYKMHRCVHLGSENRPILKDVFSHKAIHKGGSSLQFILMFSSDITLNHSIIDNINFIIHYLLFSLPVFTCIRFFYLRTCNSPIKIHAYKLQTEPATFIPTFNELFALISLLKNTHILA